jgi:hypothetical protein
MTIPKNRFEIPLPIQKIYVIQRDGQTDRRVEHSHKLTFLSKNYIHLQVLQQLIWNHLVWMHLRSKI